MKRSLPHIIVADGKEIREFDGQQYVMELALNPDVSLVKAWKADKSGNLMFRRTARNFNPNVAQAGKITVVEVEEIVETGTFDPDEVHLAGIFVHRIVLNAHPGKAHRTTHRHQDGGLSTRRQDKWLGRETRWRHVPPRNCRTAST